MDNYEKKLFGSLRDKGLIPESKTQIILDRLKGVDGSLEIVIEGILKIPQEELLAVKKSLGELPSFLFGAGQEISKDTLSEIPEEAARQYKIVPLEKSGGKLKVGVVNPEDNAVREAVRFIALGSNLEPELYVITDETFRNILGMYRTFGGVIKEALTELEQEESVKEPKKSISELPEIIKEAPVTKVVAVILKHAVEGKASDIHIEGGASRTHVRFRVQGKLYTSLFLPLRIHASLVSRIKILSNLRLDESRIPQDGRFSAEVSGRAIDFRVSTFPTRSGEKAVLRVLDSSNAIQKLDDLGLSGRNLEMLNRALALPFGMILVSGPTGSGKSTTLYAALFSMDKTSVNAVSLEDPIEYYIEGVSQSQIREEIGYTFASGLRHVLRQDPDVIMVGEIRDTETAALATHASLTGHLVLSTIHTNDVLGVIPRLVDMGVKQFFLPSSIALTLAQRLVRKLCPYCKVSGSSPPQIAKIIKREVEKMPEDVREHFNLKVKENYELWRSPGCNKCSRRGTLGRIGIFEALYMTEELKKIVYESPTQMRIKEEANRQGMTTMLQDGIIKALSGIIGIEEVLRVTEN